MRITARSGPVTAWRSVRVVGRVAAGGARGEPRGEGARGPSDSGARPREAALGAALDSLLADVSARGPAALEGLLPTEGAGARDFLTWAAGVRRLRVKRASREPPVFGRGGATVDFALVLTWHRGLRRDPARTARLRAAFVPDGGGWRLDHVELREPFSPR